MNPTFFETPAELRTWLEKNHTKATELWLGFHKKGSGKPSVTYAEALDEALCLGWIDGVRKSLGDESYTIRFTPRKPRSIWSAVNIEHVRRLQEQSRMKPAGLQAFEKRTEDKSRIYSYEQKSHPLDPAYENEIRANLKAWDFFQSQAPSYRRTVHWWIQSAKKEETRKKRLASLIEWSEKGERIPQYLSPAPKKGKKA